ncbi:hypothetical protein ElyMa_002125800 [Elysia marginata]|uniref:Peptidylprolyl isomerase n=1 Tax=Elysia marginata TaxID=1093978 RepID=A0AAV4FKV8_9GAST|nr:hypothetical protein ElyMa_002125800 [Elysia marginata]
MILSVLLYFSVVSSKDAGSTVTLTFSGRNSPATAEDMRVGHQEKIEIKFQLTQIWYGRLRTGFGPGMDRDRTGHWQEFGHYRLHPLTCEGKNGFPGGSRSVPGMRMI